jgi:hypothetical protein
MADTVPIAKRKKDPMAPHAEKQIFALGSRASILAAAVGLALAYGAGVGGAIGWLPNLGAVRYSVLGGSVALIGSAIYWAAEWYMLSRQNCHHDSIVRNKK